jgi:hypothetical protein
MAKIKLMGNQIAIVSALTLEQLDTIRRRKPEALKLKDEKGEKAVFVVDTGFEGNVSKYGVVFAAQEVIGGRAIFSMEAPSDDAVEVRKYINENWGTVVFDLNKVEAQCTEAFAAIAAEEAAIATMIEGFEPAPVAE